MKKVKRKVISFVLIVTMMMGLLPNSTVMAGQDDVDDYNAAESVYWNTSNDFWTAVEAYEGVYDEQTSVQTQKGAYDEYMDAAMSGAVNIQTLYEAAETARQNCKMNAGIVSTAYTPLQGAYNVLTMDEQLSVADGYNNATEDHTNVMQCINDLRELYSPEVYAFYAKGDAYDVAATNFWDAMTAFYGDAQQGITGALPAYEAAEASGAADVQTLYNAAEQAREACVTAYAVVEASYNDAMTAYAALDATEQAIVDVVDKKTYLDTEYTNASTEYTNLASVPTPGSSAPAASEYSMIYIDAAGNFDGDVSAPMYWKVNSTGKLVEATAADYSLKFEKTAAGTVMTLRNFVFTGAPDTGNGDAIWSDSSLILVLEGTNSITGTKGNALGVDGHLTITGSGSLTLTSTSAEITENGNTYTPMALLVIGGFINRSTVTCNSNNTDCTVSIESELKDIANTGELTVGDGQWIWTNDGRYISFTKPVSYNSSSDYPVPTDHAYVAKAYSFDSEISYPNNMCDSGSDTSAWTIVGKYDADGNPIGSNVSYQYWYVDERGVILTEDLVNPIKFLVYEDDPETLLCDKDIASVGDGRSHTFNRDLYALWFTKGNVTVNGDVIQDLACFNVGALDDTGINYVWNNGQRVWWVESTADSSVTVNGNVGLISLNDSYIGNVTVNGNVDLLAFYADMDASVVSNRVEVPETIYGSKADAGTVVVGGEYVNISNALEGYQGYCVYNTEDFYVMTQRNINGEIVHGTTAAIEGDSIQVGVTRDAVGNTTYPCVKSAESNVISTIRSLLTKTGSKLLVMDISLIQDNARKVEPQTTTNLYFENLSGFTTPAVYHIKDNGDIEKIFVYNGSGSFSGAITCETNSFSTYFIAEDQKLLSSNIGTPANTVTGVVDNNQSGNNNSGGGSYVAATSQTAQLTSPKTSDTSGATVAAVLFFVGIAVLVIGVSEKKKKYMN